MPRRAELALVPAALGAWLAGGVLIGVPDTAVLAGIGCAVGALTLTTVALRRARPSLGLVALGLATAALVAASIVAHLPTRVPDALVSASAVVRPVVLTATVTGPAVEGRLPVTVTRVAFPGAGVASARAEGMASPVLVFGRGDSVPTGLAIDSEVEFSATLAPADPGDDIAFLAFPRSEVTLVGPPPVLLDATHDLRAGFQAAVRELPGPGAALLPGLAVGDTSAVSSSLRHAMIVSSLSHLTAVSGANCAIVVALAFGIAGALGAPRIVRLVVAAVVLSGFVVLVTPEPSVLRAAVMAGIALVAVGVGRPTRGLPLLCFAVVVLLAADPWLARSFGFALSVLATAGLLVLAPPIATVIARWLPHPLAVILAVPLAAQLACQPVILLIDPALPLTGVVANLLAEPAAPVATVVGLAACLLLPVLPPVGVALAAIGWVPASWIGAVAEWASGLPGARGPWLAGLPGVVLLVAVEAAILVAVLAPPRRRIRRVMAALCALFAVSYLSTLALTRVADVGSRPADWQYAACDVGQGDAFLVRSAGRVALVDTGPDPEPLAACLTDLGIDRLDLLVLTHFDLDHVGGVEAVVGRVDRAIIGLTVDAEDERIVAALAAAGARVDPVTRGGLGTLGELRWEVLWPPPRGVTPGNQAGVTLRFSAAGECRPRCLSAAFLADLGEEAQLRMLAAARLDSVDVVKVAHHGSADQAAGLYDALRARVGLIGVGADNDYGHPTERLLGILASTGTTVMRTDRDGLVLVAPGKEPGSVEVWTEPDGGGG